MERATSSLQVLELKGARRQPLAVPALRDDRTIHPPWFSLTFGFLFSAISILAAGCGEKKAGPDKSATTEKITAKPPGDSPSPREKIVHVPVGKFTAGSLPGEPGRDPSLEPSQRQIELGPFRIDVYPYPGDPEAAPRVGVSATEAQALCASQGARLCTELEWERACRGAESAMYPTGAEPCAKTDTTCLSGFDVAKMGMLPEWTASKFGQSSDHAGQAVTRGAPARAPSDTRRCARRSPASKEEPVGFRCCYGAPNAQNLKEPELGEPYREIEITKKELTALLAADKRTKYLATDVSLFKPEAARTVLARGPGETKGFTLTTHGVEWQPVRGSKFLVVAGKSGDRTSFVVTYFLAGDQKELAGSFIMKNEPGPIALAYARSIRPRIHFSGCWGCPGETGKVLFRPPEELVLLQP